MTTHTVFPKYIINNDIEDNKSGFEILNTTTLGICRTQAIQKKCTGKHFNRQIPHGIMNQGCVCWGTSGIGITNLSLSYNVVVCYRTYSLMMREFSSKNFNLGIFQDKYFPQTIPVTELEHTYAKNNLEYSIEIYVDFINDHGGFRVVVWYSRGEINDKSSIDMATQSNEGQFDSGRMNYHILLILPTNANILKRGNQLNTELN